MNPGWRPVRAMGTYTRRSPTGMLIETYHDGYEVNEAGAYIWALVGSGASVAEIADRLAERYALPPGQAREVVAGFLADLVERGFVPGA